MRPDDHTPPAYAGKLVVIVGAIGDKINRLPLLNTAWRLVQLSVVKHARLYLAACVAVGVLVACLLVERSVEKWAISEIIERASDANIIVSVEDISTQFFRLTPSINIEKLHVGMSDAEPVVANADITLRFRWWNVLGDVPLIKSVMISKARLHLLVDDTGSYNWSPLLEAISDSLPTSEGHGAQIETFVVSEVRLEYINDQHSHIGAVNINADWLMSSEQISATAGLTGDVNLLPINLDVNMQSNVTASPESQPSTTSITGQLADSTFTFDASADDVSSLKNGEVHFRVDGESVGETMRQLGLAKTGISALQMKGSANYHADDVLRGNMGFSLDESHSKAVLAMEGLVGTRSDKRQRLMGSLKFTDLFLDPILGNTGVNNLPPTLPFKAGSSKLFSDKRPVFSKFIEKLDVDFTFEAERFYSGSLLIKNLEGVFKKKNDKSSVSINSDDFGNGELLVNLSVDAGDQEAQGKMSVNAKHIPIDDILSAVDVVEGMASGKLSGDAKFWFSGNTVAQALSTLDGGLFMLVEDGKLDSLLVEMAGADFMESIGLVFTDDLQQSAVRCGFTDIQVIGGLVSIKDFIIDTEDSVFLASGDVDLGREQIDVTFSPHPRDTSFFAATTPVRITGSLANPKFRPGAKLYTRMALAAAMAALAGPAAVVLPFVELGGGGEKSYCKELFEN